MLADNIPYISVPRIDKKVNSPNLLVGPHKSA